MKRTEYFATIEEANQYYPDGVPSGVIAIVGDGSQVLVSSDNAADGATQQYYSADMTNDEIVNTMVQDSYDEGHSDGYAEGETAGYNTGYTAGEAAGYDTGYAAGQAASGSDLEDNYLCIQKVNADGSDFQSNDPNCYFTVWSEWSHNIEYSTDKENWTSVTVTESQSTNIQWDPSNGYKVYLRGINSTNLSGLHVQRNNQSDYIKASGNIHSLYYGEYYSKFLNMIIDAGALFMNSKIVDASELNISNTRCGGMFEGCTSLVNAPILSDDVIKMYQYNGMFSGCTSLTSVVCLATQTDYNVQNVLDDCFQDCFENVETTGVFYKNSLASSSLFEGPDYNDPMIDPETGDQMYDPETGEPMYNTKTIYPSTWTIQDYVE